MNEPKLEPEISLLKDLEPYRANRDIWEGIIDAENIFDEHVEKMVDIIIDETKPLVIISHDDSDGITPSMQFRLAREALFGKEVVKKDKYIYLATGSSKESCKAIFEDSNIPNDSHIVILDLNQDKPLEALTEMGLKADGRVDHHQVGKEPLSAKIVPASDDKSFIDSTSVLARAILEHKKFQEHAFGKAGSTGEIKDQLEQARLMEKLDNLALLGLVGDKKLNEKDKENRLKKAFDIMTDMIEPYKRIANALNLMAVHPVGESSRYETAKNDVTKLLRGIDKIDGVKADQFEEIEHIANVKGVLDDISTNIAKGVENTESGETKKYVLETSKDYPGLSAEIVEQNGFKGLKVTINETGQTENLYDMAEPLWKAIYEKMWGKHDLDFIIMAIEENEEKLPNKNDLRTINYRVGTLKPRAEIDEKTTQMTKDGLMMSSIEVALITDAGGGHEERAGDAIEIGKTYEVDGEMIEINSVEELHDLMVKRSIKSLEKPKPPIIKS